MPRTPEGWRFSPSALVAAALLLGALASGNSACTLAPTRVGREEIDQGVGLGAWNVVCKGLEMESPDVRTYATTKLVPVQEPAAQECVCAHIYRENVWDDAVASGLKGARRDDLVGCLADVLEDPRLDREVELVAALKLTGAPMVPDRLFAYAQKAKDPQARALAVSGLMGTTDPARVTWLLKTLASDPSGEVRAAAAKSLKGQGGEEIPAAWRKALAEDSDGEVRLTVLQLLGESKIDDRDTLICSAIMDDPAPEVRIAALGMYKGTKREPALACLRKRAFTEEKDGQVREKILEILTSSKSREAADILCDQIAFWLETYAADDIIYNIPGLLVVEAQNDRDWKRSLECAEKANAHRDRFDCYGKQYLAHKIRELGGSAWPPPCPKTDGDSAVYRQAGGGQGVISFE